VPYILGSPYPWNIFVKTALIAVFEDFPHILRLPYEKRRAREQIKRLVK
jgi:hypothetical protein